MSRHNYTNQAFCQDEEQKIRRSHSVRSVRRYPTVEPIKQHESFRLYDGNNCTAELIEQPSHPIHSVSVRPNTLRNHTNGSTSHVGMINHPNIGSRYALIPMEFLKKSHGTVYGSTTSCLSRSHENLFNSREEMNLHNITIDGSNNFSSLPPLEMRNQSKPKTNIGLKPAFSNDFGSKSFLTLDNKYYIIPTEENEEIVDENHEIIQVHPNGETHRYAVIPSSPESENANNDQNMQMNTPTRKKSSNNYHHANYNQSSIPAVPARNSPATQKLHELLSTPLKNPRPLSRTSTYLSPRKTTSTPCKQLTSSTSPRKINFDQRSLFMASSTTLNFEQKTTAVIPPRVNSAAPIYNECSTAAFNSDMNESTFKKKLETHRQTIALIGYTSIILIILGVINSSLCIYLTYILSNTTLYVSIIT